MELTVLVVVGVSTVGVLSVALLLFGIINKFASEKSTSQDSDAVGTFFVETLFT